MIYFTAPRSEKRFLVRLNQGHLSDDKTIIFNITQRGDESFYTLSLPQDKFWALYARRVVRGSLLSRNHVSKKTSDNILTTEAAILCGCVVEYDRKSSTRGKLSQSTSLAHSSWSSRAVTQLELRNFEVFQRGKKHSPAVFPGLRQKHQLVIPNTRSINGSKICTHFLNEPVGVKYGGVGQGVRYI